MPGRGRAWAVLATRVQRCKIGSTLQAHLNQTGGQPETCLGALKNPQPLVYLIHTYHTSTTSYIISFNIIYHMHGHIVCTYDIIYYIVEWYWSLLYDVSYEFVPNIKCYGCNNNNNRLLIAAIWYHLWFDGMILFPYHMIVGASMISYEIGYEILPNIKISIRYHGHMIS